MSRRFRWSALLTLPLFALAMAEMAAPRAAHALPAGALAWIQLLLATPVVLWGGWPFFERAWRSLRTRQLNMFTLIALGTGAAWASQPARHPRARACIRPRFAATAAACRSISRPPR